jgi:hypothetical protein
VLAVSVAITVSVIPVAMVTVAIAFATAGRTVAISLSGVTCRHSAGGYR